MFKHRLNICGMLILVWGPESIDETYKCFIKYVAEKLHTDAASLMWALQLSPIENLVDHAKAYQAFSKIYAFVNQTTYSHNREHFLKCDSFLSSSPPSRFVKARIVKPVATTLNRSTEIPVDEPKSTSVGTLSKSWNSMWIHKIRDILTLLQRANYTPAPQTIILALGIMSVFGFLVLPIH